MFACDEGSRVFQPVAWIGSSRRLLLQSGMTSCGSTFIRVPRPEHVGHAPNGLLNENSRGSSASMLTLQSGHA